MCAEKNTLDWSQELILQSSTSQRRVEPWLCNVTENRYRFLYVNEMKHSNKQTENKTKQNTAETALKLTKQNARVYSIKGSTQIRKSQKKQTYSHWR